MQSLITELCFEMSQLVLMPTIQDMLTKCMHMHALADALTKAVTRTICIALRCNWFYGTELLYNKLMQSVPISVLEWAGQRLNWALAEIGLATDQLVCTVTGELFVP